MNYDDLTRSEITTTGYVLLPELIEIAGKCNGCISGFISQG